MVEYLLELDRITQVHMVFPLTHMMIIHTMPLLFMCHAHDLPFLTLIRF